MVPPLTEIDHPVRNWTRAKRKKALWILSAGHFVNDVFTAVLGAIMPLIIYRYDLTLAQAGWLATIYAVSGALTQPLYGFLADRVRRRWFVILGPVISAVFIACLTRAPGYWGLALLLFVAGSGTAMFHPQGAAYTHLICGHRKGFGVSFFIAWGNIGFALGPILVVGAINWLGWENLYLAGLTGILYFALSYRFLPNPEHRAAHHRGPSLVESIRPVWFPIAVLYLLVVLRSMVQMNMSNFLTTYFKGMGYSLEWASLIFTLYLFLGGAGGFFGGTLADRLGKGRVIIWSMVAAIPFYYGFLLTQGILSIAFLMISGGLMFATLPVNLIYAQDLAPKNASTVSALIMGFGWGLAGFTVPVCGRIGDSHGLTAALSVMGTFLILGSLLAFLLPKEKGEGNPTGAVSA